MTLSPKQIPFPFEVRLATENDLPFVYGAWLESYKENSNKGTCLNKAHWQKYKPLQTAVINNILKSGVVMVAFNPTDPEHIIGFACGTNFGEVGILHYVYIRPNRQRVGLATHLVASVVNEIKAPIKEYSHQTKSGKLFARSLNLDSCSFITMNSLINTITSPKEKEEGKNDKI